jgi:hypothetical protein
MPSQRDNEINNRLSRARQQKQRDRNAALDAIGGLNAYGFSYSNEQLLEDFKRRLTTIGNSYDTRQSRRLRDAVDQLEAARSAAINKLDAELDATISDINNLEASADSSRIQMPTLDEREEQAGLNLAGNDPLSGQRTLDSLPNTMEERERAAGLFNTTSGYTDVKTDTTDTIAPEVELEDSFGTFPVIICIDGSPFSATIVGQIGGQLT